jgi:hypothetical protein
MPVDPPGRSGVRELAQAMRMISARQLPLDDALNLINDRAIREQRSVHKFAAAGVGGETRFGE